MHPATVRSRLRRARARGAQRECELIQKLGYSDTLEASPLPILHCGVVLPLETGATIWRCQGGGKDFAPTTTIPTSYVRIRI
jgi:hypothetical protein